MKYHKVLFFVIVVLVLGFSSNSFSQSKVFESEREAYDYWAKRGIIEVFYAYMNDFLETTGEEVHLKELSGKRKYESTYISNGNYQSYDLNEISKFLKENGWSKAEKNILIPLKDKYSRNSDLDKDFFAAQKGSGDFFTKIPGKNNEDLNSNRNWNKKIDEIIKSYTYDKKQFENSDLEFEEKSNVQSNEISKILDLNEEPFSAKDHESKSYAKYVINFGFLIIGLLLGALLVYVIVRNEIYSILKLEKETYFNGDFESEDNFSVGFLSLVSILKSRKDFYKSKVKLEQEDNSKEISELIRSKDALKNEKEILTQENQELKNTIKGYQKNEFKKDNLYENKKEFKNEEVKLNFNMMFFTIPNEDGVFDLSFGEKSMSGEMYYRIDFLENEKEGKLNYLSGGRDQKAINRLEKFLQPVCDVENFSEASSAKKIEMIKPGKVFLRNEAWVIDPNNKIKVKLY